jgi:hypothetical protein
MRTSRVREGLRSREELVLLLRMSAWALILPVLRRCVRLDRLAQIMWLDPRGASRVDDADRIVELSRLVARRRLPMSENRCLERSLLAYRYLSARHVDPKLIVALRTADEAPRGHAWITIAGDPVGEPGSLDDYVPILVYGRGGRRDD